MGFFSRIKRGAKSKANAALDKAISPEKELDMVILELEEQRKSALQELVSYKATAKQMEQEISKFQKRADDFERKAMLAVKAGDDELAKQALRESRRCREEVVKIGRDRDEAAGYAIELNRSRKTLEVKLTTLKLKKGTMAAQIAAARGNDVFSTDNALWDKLERAEDKIEAESIEAEVDAAMKGEELEGGGARMSDAELASRLLMAGEAGGAVVDDADPLAQLKAKMAADDEQKRLPPKEDKP